ncbi:secondary thiamine-phosphate synthase enzyme YjbQ [Candidatus Altiarchaeota archaeon]
MATDSTHELLEVTSLVAKAVSDSGIREGVCVVYCPHTTAGVTINENADPDVKADLLKSLDDIVKDIGFRHCEGNSCAHVKASIMGASQSIPITAGILQLGTWQGIYFCEFDGPRKRKLIVAFYRQ